MISPKAEDDPRADELASERSGLKLAGGLVLGGFVFKVAVHFGQFVGVLIALGGLLVLHDRSTALSGQPHLVASWGSRSIRDRSGTRVRTAAAPFPTE